MKKFREHHSCRAYATGRFVAPCDGVRALEGESCVVKGCANKVGDVRFVGDVCQPCHQMLVDGHASRFGATFVHVLRDNLAEERERRRSAEARVTRMANTVALTVKGFRNSSMDESSVKTLLLRLEEAILK